MKRTLLAAIAATLVFAAAATAATLSFSGYANSSQPFGASVYSNDGTLTVTAYFKASASIGAAELDLYDSSNHLVCSDSGYYSGWNHMPTGNTSLSCSVDASTSGTSAGTYSGVLRTNKSGSVAVTLTFSGNVS